MPAPARSAPPTASTAAPVYWSLPAAMPTTPLRYLSVSSAGSRQPPGDVGAGQRGDVGAGQVRRRARCRPARSGPRSRPRDRRAGRSCGPPSSPSARPARPRPPPARCSRPPRWARPRRRPGRRRRWRPRRDGRTARAARRTPPIPTSPSTISSAAATASSPGDHPAGLPGGRAAPPGASWSRPGRPRPGRRAGPAGTRVEGVAAVVAAADEQHDAAAVHLAEQVGAGGGEAGRGALHQRALGQPGHQRLFGAPDLVGGVGGAHVHEAILRRSRKPSPRRRRG